MNSAISAIAKVGLLCLLGALAFLGASKWAGVSPDAIIGLVGALVGAGIAAAVQFATSQSEQLDRYRLAAIDRRLQAHQEAFALWRKLITHVHHEDEIGAVVLECQTWWSNNCLYLDDKSRRAFRFAYICAAGHKDYVKDRTNTELVKKNWSDIEAAGEALAKGVSLPPIGDLVSELRKEPK